jgi:23S rRNA (adenine2503-C2)-methyltransferase
MSNEYKFCPEDQIQDWFTRQGHPAYRRRQLEDWLFGKWAISTEELLNLPKKLREQIDADFTVFSVAQEETEVAGDETTKFLLRLGDGETIESVIIPTRHRETVCISTQVGCPVGCVFCATGRQGFVRNLSPGEILDQVIFACHHLRKRVTNVVVMGMGEPLLNLDALIPALHKMTDADGLDIGVRKITISTSGIPDGIRALAAENRQWNLALSLHAPDETTRRKIIPDRHRFPLSEIFDACSFYKEETGRIITFEYAMIQDLNDDPEQARKVAILASQIGAKVNLIPYNSVVASLASAEAGRVREFKQQLHARGIPVTVREPRGTDINAACGQLKGRRELRTPNPGPRE